MNNSADSGEENNGLMSRFWSSTLQQLAPYVPGEQPKDNRYIKLNTNENPYPPSPAVIAAIKAAVNESLRLYPDPGCEDLRAAIARYHRTEKANIFVGNGSDEILALAFLAFFQQPYPILFPDITYSFYAVYCDLFRIESRQVPVNADFQIRLADYQHPNGGIIFANPNALTGCAVTLEEIRQLLENTPDSVTVIDEAYIDFGGESAIGLIAEFPNLLVIQTFSKSRSLAGLRVGFALGADELINGLRRVKNSFNSYTLDRLALVGAVAAINDEPYFQQVCRQVVATREWTVRELASLGFNVVPSNANFIFIRHGAVPAKTLYEQLKERGILVRYFDKPKVDNYLRVTIGTREEMTTFLETTAAIIGGCPR